MDRAWWGPGPWEQEPDDAYWMDLDYPCVAARNALGSWCGYVAVPPGHPFWGKAPGQCVLNCEPHIMQIPEGDDDLSVVIREAIESGSTIFADRTFWDCDHRLDLLVRVHGGVTWANSANEFISHPDAAPDAWYVGFDCGHAWDLSPGLQALINFRALRKQLDVLPTEGEQFFDRVDEMRQEFGIPLPPTTYRTLDYVKQQVHKLAEQCVAYGAPLYKLQRTP